MQTQMQSDPNEEVRVQFRIQVESACWQLRRSRFQQEPGYVAALMGKLAGMDIQIGSSWLTTTVVNDHGPHCAESEFGADFAIIFESTSGTSKAVLGQAKGSSIESLSPKERKNFFGQCQLMAKKTKHFIGLEVPKEPDTMPIVRMGLSGPPVDIELGRRLDDYLADIFIGCQHGDRRNEFVRAVEKSDLLRLRVMVSE